MSTCKCSSNSCHSNSLLHPQISLMRAYGPTKMEHNIPHTQLISGGLRHGHSAEKEKGIVTNHKYNWTFYHSYLVVTDLMHVSSTTRKAQYLLVL
jgi:hypothetical protein